VNEEQADKDFYISNSMFQNVDWISESRSDWDKETPEEFN
jgi:hypothetical protein